MCYNNLTMSYFSCYGPIQAGAHGKPSYTPASMAAQHPTANTTTEGQIVADNQPERVDPDGTKRWHSKTTIGPSQKQ